MRCGRGCQRFENGRVPILLLQGPWRLVGEVWLLKGRLGLQEALTRLLLVASGHPLPIL
jgi:hypothetical protein